MAESRVLAGPSRFSHPGLSTISIAGLSSFSGQDKVGHTGGTNDRHTTISKTLQTMVKPDPRRFWDDSKVEEGEWTEAQGLTFQLYEFNARQNSID